MKKFLLSAILVASLGYFNQATAQCNGASVTIFNITVTNPVLGEYDWSYDWKFVQGNASISAVLKCGGVDVATSVCNSDLKKKANSDQNAIFHESGKLILPDPNCAGVKELEFRIYASQNCGGTFCPVGTNITLPVSFAKFNATRNKSAVNVEWSTASEQNSSSFTIERNVRGVWEDVATIPSQAVGGNSDALLNYFFTDQNPTNGISQYRVKQVDFDAKSKYSEVRAVRGEGQAIKLTVYPNPTNNGKVSVVFEDDNASRDVSVMDMSGRIVKQFKALTNNNITIDNLNPGMYSLRVFVPATGAQSIEKIVVNKR